MFSRRVIGPVKTSICMIGIKQKLKTELLGTIKKERKSQGLFICDILSNWKDFHDLLLLPIIIIHNMRRGHLSILDLGNVLTTAVEEGYRKQEKGRKPCFFPSWTSDNLWLKWLIWAFPFQELLMLKRGCATKHQAMAVSTPEHWRRLANAQESEASQACCMLITKCSGEIFLSYVHRQENTIRALLT